MGDGSKYPPKIIDITCPRSTSSPHCKVALFNSTSSPLSWTLPIFYHCFFRLFVYFMYQLT